jgi:hypothetical protein
VRSQSDYDFGYTPSHFRAPSGSAMSAVRKPASLCVQNWRSRSAFFRKLVLQNNLCPEASPPHAVLQLGGLALTATTPRPPRFGQVSTKNRSKSNSDNHLHPRSCPATGFILARSESRRATVLAGGVGNLANCPGDWRAGLASWHLAYSSVPSVTLWLASQKKEQRGGGQLSCRASALIIFKSSVDYQYRSRHQS